MDCPQLALPMTHQPLTHGRASGLALHPVPAPREVGPALPTDVCRPRPCHPAASRELLPHDGASLPGSGVAPSGRGRLGRDGGVGAYCPEQLVSGISTSKTEKQRQETGNET